MLKSICMGLLAMALPAALAQDAPAVEADKAPAKGGYINLELDGVGADEAFDQLGQQAGVDLLVNQPQVWFNTDPVYLDVKNGYFWPVFLNMCKQSDLRFDMHSPGRGVTAIRLYNAQQGQTWQYEKAPQSIHEGFIVTAIGAARSYNVTYGQERPNTSQFTIQLAILLDPQLNVMDVGAPVLELAEDDAGKSLLINAREGRMFYGGGRQGLMHNATVVLQNPLDIGKRITKLKGTLPARAITEYETLEATSFADPIRRELGGFDLTVEPLTRRDANARQWTMKVTFEQRNRTRGGLRSEMQDYWNLINLMQVMDKDGKRLTVSGGGGSSSDGTATYTVNITANEGAGEPAKLVWRLPKQMRQINIPFEFSDLPIP